MYKFSYLFKLQTSDNNINSDEYNRLFLLNAHHLHYMSSRVAWIWYILLLILPFTINRLSKIVHFTWKVLSLKMKVSIVSTISIYIGLAICSYSSLEFPHAASSRENIQGTLVVRK